MKLQPIDKVAIYTVDRCSRGIILDVGDSSGSAVLALTVPEAEAVASAIMTAAADVARMRGYAAGEVG